MKNSKKRRLNPNMERQEVVKSMLGILSQKQIQPIRIIQKEHLMIHVFINIQKEDAFLKIREEVYKTIQEEIDISIFNVFLKNNDEYWGDEEEDTDVTHWFLDMDASINNHEIIKYLLDGVPFTDVNQRSIGQHIDYQEDLTLDIQNNFIDFHPRIDDTNHSLGTFFIEKINDKQNILHNAKYTQQNTEWLVA